ncbi:Por secretion system C-terminal sorting domain-containing protein [Fodinibius roseus]|uniref:Por secretion system C-terminal sorting domain-containing protein n=1 Tax=Fodinibius roseus TaxID=1194090 RepID=A0A1M4ZPI5_9BACT|nr:S8 family peptidase [Fodinibius roseus]SHF19953.1 Por secretion system C-terminal sorting domain-containing protein [Fodinibius roseus]
MITTIPSRTILLLLLFLPLAAMGQQPNYAPDRLLIKYESDQRLRQLKGKLTSDPRAAVEQFLRLSGMRTIQPLMKTRQRQKLRRENRSGADDLLRIHEATFSQRIDPLHLSAKVERMPGVAYAEPKYIRRLHLTPNDSTLEKFIDFHRFSEAWDLSTSGPEVVIAIVDGGVNYTHPELDDKLWVNQEEVPNALRPTADQNADGSVTATEIGQYLRDNGEDYNGDGQIQLDDALHPGAPFTDRADGDSNGYTDDLFGWDFRNSDATGQVAGDHNPMHDGTDHGTHVAGIAAAETNNQSGIAGAGFNSTYMAVKAGGTPDDPTSVGYGFEGILYAAEQGADIINCSWGGDGFSNAEQDVINYVTRRGALVVSSSGNDGVDKVSYPAGYDNVLGVGSVETSDMVSGYSNYGYELDVLATGSGLLSTSYGESFTSKSGTSMAAPVVSGLAALLRSIHPGWSAERIGQQIRTSAVSVENDNASGFAHKLGSGKIDAFNALNTDQPGLKLTSVRFENREGEKLQLNQPGTVYANIVNVGKPVSDIDLQPEAVQDEGIELSAGSTRLPPLSTGDSTEITFELTIGDDFDLRATPAIRLNFRDPNGSYEDFGIAQYEEFLHDVVAENRVKTSFGSDGTIGFTKPLLGAGGVGFVPRTRTSGGYAEGRNLLFEGGLMVEIDGTLYDAVRSETGRVSRDFTPLELFTTTRNESVSDLDGHATFRLESDTTHDATIRLQTYAYNHPRLSNAVLLQYTLRNNSSFRELTNVYVGLFNDWDIGDSADNNASFMPADSLLYFSEATENSSEPITAVATMGPISGILAIDNTTEGSQDSLSFGLYDGFTDTEKRSALKARKTKTGRQHSDISGVVASGPYTLDPGAEIVVGFAYAFGDDAEVLADQVAAARAQKPFEVSPAGRAVSDEEPAETKLFQNYPNPFRRDTQIRFDLAKASHVTLTIYDVLGRRVRVLRNAEMGAKSHFVTFDADGLSSGVYFARLKTPDGVRVLPMTLIK